MTKTMFLIAAATTMPQYVQGFDAPDAPEDCDTFGDSDCPDRCKVDSDDNCVPYTYVVRSRPCNGMTSMFDADECEHYAEEDSKTFTDGADANLAYGCNRLDDGNYQWNSDPSGDWKAHLIPGDGDENAVICRDIECNHNDDCNDAGRLNNLNKEEYCHNGKCQANCIYTNVDADNGGDDAFCTDDAGCEVWENPSGTPYEKICMEKCSKFTTKWDCLNYAAAAASTSEMSIDPIGQGCSWDGSTETCKASCIDGYAMTGGEMCDTNCKIYIALGDGYSVDPGAVCQEKCDNFDTEDRCLGDANYMSPDFTLTEADYPHTALPRCTWHKGQCQDACHTIVPAQCPHERCDLIKRDPNTAGPACKAPCKSITEEDQCEPEGDERCVWVDSLGGRRLADNVSRRLNEPQGYCEDANWLYAKPRECRADNDCSEWASCNAGFCKDHKPWICASNECKGDGVNDGALNLGDNYFQDDAAGPVQEARLRCENACRVDKTCTGFEFSPTDADPSLFQCFKLQHIGGCSWESRYNDYRRVTCFKEREAEPKEALLVAAGAYCENYDFQLDDESSESSFSENSIEACIRAATEDPRCGNWLYGYTGNRRRNDCRCVSPGETCKIVRSEEKDLGKSVFKIQAKCDRDTDEWYYGDRSRSCNNFVAKDPKVRCRLKGRFDFVDVTDDEKKGSYTSVRISAAKACPTTCGGCGCSDDDHWHLRPGVKGKNCKWVGKNPHLRCDNMGIDKNGIKVRAFDGCCYTCKNQDNRFARPTPEPTPYPTVEPTPEPTVGPPPTRRLHSASLPIDKSAGEVFV